MELISTKEKRVLGALYKIGQASINSIAKETLINRTALYHTVSELENKGLVTKVTRENTLYFQAIPMHEYESWAKRQVSMIVDQTSDLQDWLKNQKTQVPTLHSDVRYFEGVEGVKNLYADSWRDNKEKVICAITDYDKAYEVLGDFMEKEYFPDRVKNKVAVKSLLSKSSVTAKKDIARAKDLLRDMRFVNVFKDLGIEVNVYGEKVSIIALDKKKPSGILIKNPVIAKAFKAIFEYIWVGAKK